MNTSTCVCDDRNQQTTDGKKTKPLHLLFNRPDDTQTHAHVLLLRSSPPATLRRKSHDGPHPALRNSQESPPPKKHQQTKSKKSGFRGKARSGFDPSGKKG